MNRNLCRDGRDGRIEDVIRRTLGRKGEICVLVGGEIGCEFVAPSEELDLRCWLYGVH